MRKLSAYKRSLGFLTAAFAFAAAVTGCSSSSSSSEQPTEPSSTSLVSSEEDTLTAKTVSNTSDTFGDIFSDRDLDPSYSDITAEIDLSGSSAKVSGSDASVSGSVITVSQKGVYRITGTLDDGQIIVDADDAKVQLVFSGASITSKTSAPVYVKNADKVFITLAEGTENTLTSNAPAAAEGSDEPDAAIFSADSLTFNGSGSLKVVSASNDGIRCKDDVVVTGGSITVDAANNGIKAKDYFAAAGGSVTVKAGNDGIKSTNSEDASLGFIYISSGSFNITADGDGFSASTVFYAESGEYSIVSGGGSSNSTKSHSDGFGSFGGGGFGKGGFGGGNMPEMPTNEDGSFSMPGGFGGGNMPEIPTNEDGSFSMPGGDMPDIFINEDNGSDKFRDFRGTLPDNFNGSSSQDSDDSTSAKAIKAGSEITVTGGKFTLDSADDALHSNGSLTLTGGEFSIEAGDDGLHADIDVSISGSSKVDITKSYEGIEAATIGISGGNTSVKASDDGLNASDGTSQGGMGTYSSGVSINITGGTLYVNADGDGIDSNGDIKISGGTTVVDGPTNSANGALDSNGDITVTGGVVVAAGASGMAEAPSKNSTQNSVSATFDSNLSAGTSVALKDSSGKEIIAFTSAKSFNNIVISSPDISDGETYTFYTGGKCSSTSDDHLCSGYSGGSEAGSFTVSSVLSTVGKQSGFGGGNMPEMPTNEDGSFSMPDGFGKGGRNGGQDGGRKRQRNTDAESGATEKTEKQSTPVV